MELTNFENQQLHAIFTRVTFEAIIFNDFFLNVNFIVCGACVAYYHMSRRAVGCTSNTGGAKHSPLRNILGWTKSGSEGGATHICFSDLEVEFSNSKCQCREIALELLSRTYRGLVWPMKFRLSLMFTIDLDCLCYENFEIF